LAALGGEIWNEIVHSTGTASNMQVIDAFVGVSQSIA
jgi:hypothetical protein